MATLKDMLELAGKAILEQHVDGNGDVKGDILAQAATVSSAVSLKRIADALETLARNDTARTCFTGDGSANTAQLNVGANCDVRQVG